MALALGRVDVEAMLDEIDWKQFRLWRAYFAVEPWGEHRADWRSGLLACAVERLIYGDEASWTPDQFFWRFERTEREPEEPVSLQRRAEEDLAIVRTFAAVWNASH